MRIKKYLVRGTLTVGVLATALFGASLASAKLELNEHGVHQRLLMPLGPMGDIAIPLYTGTGEQAKIAGFIDGPVVRLASDGSWSAKWFCEDHMVERRGTSAKLDIECAGKTRRVMIAPPAPIAPAAFPMPDKLLVLSDIEGNLPFLDTSLAALGVTDSAGNWRFGKNAVVIAGDAVDRGREVFGVLYRLHSLSLQAQAAGGSLTLVLGNHEQYLLRGNTSRANRDHLYAMQQLGGQADAFAADTVLGRWLRDQPVIAKAGKVLIAHGGISASVAATGLSITQLNDAMRRYWQGREASRPELDAVIGIGGVSQYRGYLQSLDENYAKATDADLAAVLSAFDAETVVVGHTLVDRVTPLFDGRVYAIDVNANEAAHDALLFEHGKARVVDAGTGRLLPAARGKHSRRSLDLGGAADWQLLGRIVETSYALSRLPHPY